MMQGAGVGLLAGTDLPLSGVQSRLPDELGALVEAGLTPLEALRTTTSNAAAFLGWNGGSVEEGRLADLVLLAGNPLEDIRSVRSVTAVVLRGRLIGSDELAAIRREAGP